MRPDALRSKLILHPKDVAFDAQQDEAPVGLIIPGQGAPKKLVTVPEAPKLVLPGDEGFFIPKEAAQAIGRGRRGRGNACDWLDSNKAPEVPARERLTVAKMEAALKSGEAVVAKTAQDSKYAVRLFPSFEPERRVGVRLFRVPDTQPLDEIVANAPPHDHTTLAVYIPTSDKRPWAAARNEVLGALDAALAFDPNDFESFDLDPKTGAIRSFENWLPAPFVRRNGEWARVSPQPNHKKSLPAGEAVVPKSVARQPAEHGALFATTIKDTSAFSNKRNVGVYFPPSYDETRAAPYPVLVMLPGAGSNLEHWTSWGRCIDQLDHAMAGEAEKMIVVFPEVTGTSASDALTKSVLPHVFEHYHADADRLALGGISRGGTATLDITSDDITKFKSVSFHSAAISGDRDVEKFVDILKNAEHPPRVFIDIGEHDKYESFISGSSRLSAQLDDAGHNHQFAVIDDHPSGAKHNWHLWGSQLSKWIGFHQATFGVANAPMDTDGKDVGAVRKAAAITGDQELWDKLEAAIEGFGALATESERVAERGNDFPGEVAKKEAARVTEVIVRTTPLAEDARRISATRDPKNPRVLSSDGQAVLYELRRSKTIVADVDEHFDALAAFRTETQSTLDGLRTAEPALHAELERLAGQRWETVWHVDALTASGLVDGIADLNGPAATAFVSALRSNRPSFQSKAVQKLLDEHPTLVFHLMRAERMNLPVEVQGESKFGKPKAIEIPRSFRTLFDGPPHETVGRIERALVSFMFEVKSGASPAGTKKKKRKKKKWKNNNNNNGGVEKRLDGAADLLRAGVKIVEKKTVADVMVSR